MRIRSIDAFRGLAIMLMVFFTLTFMFSRQLPDLITHNAAGSLHLGDFVLPMFLFASGMSLVFFHEKRKKKKKLDYALDVIERFGKLVLISFFISPFSAGGFLQMDEVMLSAVLFLGCVFMAGLPGEALVFACLLVFTAYFALHGLSLLPDFSAYYLGGYPAAVFYLPVMLGGVIAGKRVAAGKGLAPALLGTCLLVLALLLVVPPYKNEATPSFMALSVAVSLLVFVLVERAIGTECGRKRTSEEMVLVGRKRESILEYLGRQPIRYWVLMFVLVRVPVEFYTLAMGSELPLQMGWESAVALALGCMVGMYVVSRAVDFVSVKVWPSSLSH